MSQDKHAATKAAHIPGLARRPIKEEEYVKLWQYFSDRADGLKDKLWTVATWLLALAGVLMGFIFSQEFVRFGAGGPSMAKPGSALALSLVGMLVCVFGWLVIFDYGRHIQRNWDRADVLKDKITPLDQILRGKSAAGDAKEAEEESPEAGGEGGKTEEGSSDEEAVSGLLDELMALPGVCHQLMLIVLGFFVIFAAIALVANWPWAVAYLVVLVLGVVVYRLLTG